MFRNIGVIGHMLTFEYYAWHSSYNTICVPLSMVSLRMGNRSVYVSTPEYGWRSDYDEEPDAKKVFREFLACIQSAQRKHDFDSISVESSRYSSKPIHSVGNYDAVLKAAIAHVEAENKTLK